MSILWQVSESVEELLGLLEQVAKLGDHLAVDVVDFINGGHPSLLCMRLRGYIVQRSTRVITVF